MKQHWNKTFQLSALRNGSTVQNRTLNPVVQSYNQRLTFPPASCVVTPTSSDKVFFRKTCLVPIAKFTNEEENVESKENPSSSNNLSQNRTQQSSVCSFTVLFSVIKGVQVVKKN